VLKRTSLFSIAAICGLLGATPPALSQALTPYVLPLDYDLMAEQGLYLANEAQQLADFQQFDQALALAQLAAQLAPDNGQVLALLGGLYLQTGDTEQAVALLEEAETLAPEDPRILFSLGTAYFQRGDYLKASNYLERGLKIEPNNPAALFDLGNAYFQLKQYDKAISNYSASVESEPNFWPSVNNIGLVLYEQGKPDEALNRWREALEIAPEEPEPKLAVAVALYDQENCNQAAAVASSSSACQEALDLGIEALEQDSRYANPEFLIENLWGNRLIDTTNAFFEVPAIQNLLAEL
jgi:tetratricopeptide (TPR) repeat protein